ncbi:MAG: M28 family peptidase [Sediminibacterium sp.]
MKKISMMLLLGSITTFSFAQDIDKIINSKEVERIERILSADDMEGRRVFTRGIDKAAVFIADEFKNTGLQTLNNNGSYLQPFSILRPKIISSSAVVNGAAVEAKDMVIITSKEDLKITEKSGFEKVTIPQGVNFAVEAAKYTNPKKNYFVFVDTSFTKTFAQSLGRARSTIYKSDYSTVFVLFAGDPQTYSIEAKYEFTEQKLANVVGILPGKSKKNEYIIFGGHYDHLGIQAKDRQGNILTDSVFNGANDDAAGTTAVMMLAKYFKALNNNERTLIFVAFTGEEAGGFGATYFSRQYNPADIMAMFNIEMIGTESQWGKNSAYITGYDKSDMGQMMQANLEGSGFTFHPDPYTTQGLFLRSDNATLARLGVPAHTISTAKMENPPEPNYHKASDEIGTLDMENMAKIIKSIAISSTGFVNGKQTPSRVNPADVRR